MSKTFRLTHRWQPGLAPSHCPGRQCRLPNVWWTRVLPLALALLQFVQALGVTESGTLRFLPGPLLVPGLAWPASEPTALLEKTVFVGDGDCTSSIDWSESLPVAGVSACFTGAREDSDGSLMMRQGRSRRCQSHSVGSHEG